MLLHHEGDRLALSNLPGGERQLGAQRARQQTGHHAERRDERDPSSQQHAERAVETRQVVDAQPALKGGHRAQPIHRPVLHGRARRSVDQPDSGEDSPRRHLAAVRLQQFAPLEQPLRQQRQIPSDVFIHAAELRHDVEEQERHDEAARRQQHERIDRRADQLLAHALDLGLIADEARQGLAQVAGPLAGPDARDIERRKTGRILLERR